MKGKAKYEIILFLDRPHIQQKQFHNITLEVYRQTKKPHHITLFGMAVHTSSHIVIGQSQLQLQLHIFGQANEIKVNWQAKRYLAQNILGARHRITNQTLHASLVSGYFEALSGGRAQQSVQPLLPLLETNRLYTHTIRIG